LPDNTPIRSIFLDDELKGVIETQWNNRKRGKKITPYVFTTRTGDKLKDIRKSWNKACRDASIGYGYKINNYYVKKWCNKLPAGPTFHDFRRSTVRNLVRSGVSENTAMKVTGHKTRSVFDRYDIVDEKDLKNAVQMQRTYLDSAIVTNLVTVDNFERISETNTNE